MSKSRINDHPWAPGHQVFRLQITIYKYLTHEVVNRIWMSHGHRHRQAYRQAQTHTHTHTRAPWGPIRTLGSHGAPYFTQKEPMGPPHGAPPWGPFAGKKYSRLCREKFFPPSRPWGPHGAPPWGPIRALGSHGAPQQNNFIISSKIVF